MAYAGVEYGKFGEAVLRDVPWAVFNQYKDRLPDTWRRRAEHFYGEYDRVQRGAEAWRRGDIEAYGRLSFESGHSSIYNWETGSDELRTLYEIMCRTDGIYLAQRYFNMYRWHITDPVYFNEDLKVTIQALGWREGRRFMPLQDDIASVAFWYQDLPAAKFPPLPDRDYLEII